MQKHSDAQLLGLYAGESSDAAFSEIVARHADLVYSAALRQLDSADLARDVAQSVFTDLARKARSLAEKLPDNASLVGWLYRSARFSALNQLRADRRRQSRERQVMENFNPSSETSVEWEHVRPVLDEAMADLRDEDREAVLLRYFKKYDLHEVGVALGVSEDAAQKRVSRAVERLREFFAKRGIAAGAGGLVVVISTNAVQAAPVGLVVTISTAAVLTGKIIATTASATATKAIAMTTLQKTLVTATVAVLAGTGIYEARQASQLRDQIQTLKQQQTPLAEQIQQLQRERDDATNWLALLAGENERLNRNTAELLRLRREVTRSRVASAQTENDPMEMAAQPLLARIKLLKQRLLEHPEENIPELQFAIDRDWFFCAMNELESEADYRVQLSMLRSGAKNQFAKIVIAALKQFADANNHQFPTDLSQLTPYFASPIDDTVLKRWKILPANTFSSVHLGGDWVIAENSQPVDEDKDFRLIIGSIGVQNIPFN